MTDIEGGTLRRRDRPGAIPDSADDGSSSARTPALVAAGGLAVFVVVAVAVAQGWTAEFDEAVLRAFRDPDDLQNPLGPIWFEDTMAEYTVLGGYTILATLAVLVGTGLWLLHERTAALMLAFGLGSGTVVAQVAKHCFDRARPDLVDHLDRTMTSAFPSAHATVSMVAYLTLAMITIRYVPRHAMRVYIVAAAIGLSVLIGVSRIYLGVHWPSDVIAGWSLGASWAALCWLAAHHLSRHHSFGRVRGLGHSRM